MGRAERIVVVAVLLAVALLLRWGFVATSSVVEPLRADAGQYAQYAANLLSHGTFSLEATPSPRPDSFRSPGYPVVLAACQALGGDRWQAWVRALQVALGTATVLLTLVLARTVLPFAAAMVAAAGVAFSPHLVVGCGYVLTETVAGFALTLAFVLLARCLRRPDRRGPALAAGVALGIAALVNESLTALLPVVALATLRTLGWRRAGLLLAGALLPVVAWGLRNAGQDLARTGGDRVLASLSHGSYPDLFFATEEYRGYPYREDPEQPAMGESWQRFRAVFTDRFGQRPGTHLAWYLLHKPLWLWDWPIVQGAGDVYVYQVRNSLFEEQPVCAALRWLMRWLHWPMAVLALGAAVAAGLRRRAPPLLRCAGLVLLLSTALYALFLPDPRYLLPFRPLAWTLAAAAGAAVWLRVRRPCPSPRPSASPSPASAGP